MRRAPSKALGLGDRRGRVPCRLRETRAEPLLTLLGQIYVICVLAFAVSVLIMAVGS